MTRTRLTRRQWQVLDALAARGHASREDEVWRKGCERGHWPESLMLHGHLRKLAQRGLVERSGDRGYYHYEITPAGRAALESFS